MKGTGFTKSQKKIAQIIIEKGLQKEFADGIVKLENTISKWKAKTFSNREAWYELYEKLTKHDKHIARRYDSMSGSRYLDTIARQLAEGAVKVDDLEDFNEDVREKIFFLSGIDNE